MKKISNILFLYFFVFVMCMGASFAWYAWKGSEVNVNVNFADLDPYIKYTPLTIKDSDKNKTLTESNSYTGGICYNLEFNKKENGSNLDAYGQNYLKVTSATDSDIFKASNLKWTLVNVSNNVRKEISTGNFVGENVVEGNDTSKMIPVSIDFSLTKESDNTSYEFCLWLDGNSYQNTDISGKNITVSIASSASTVKDVDEMYIRSIEYEVGVIKNFTAYSSKYDISGYKIVNTETTPSYSDNDWITISSNEDATIESGKVVTIKPNKTMDTINNICIKNSNNEVYCKSIGKYSDEVDRPTNTLCNNLTYNGKKQQLVSSTSGTGYTFKNYTGTNAGDYTITASLKDNYVWKDGTNDNVTFKCNIKQKDLTVKALDQTINYGESISQTAYTYDGLVGDDTIASITLTPSTSEVTTIGTITPLISMILNDGEDSTENYDIKIEKGKLIIKALSIEDSTITLNPTSYTYDGNAKKPTVTVVLNSKTLVLNTDYSVSYSNNTNAGTATVTVTGKGNYTGSKSINFTIDKKGNTLSVIAKTLTYNKSAQALVSASNAQGSVYYAVGTELTSSNYSTSGSTTIPTKTDAGSYTVYYYTPGNGNYSAKSGNVTSKINAYNLTNATIASVSNQTYTGSVITPTPAVTVPLPSSSSPTTLVNNTDFTYSYSNNINAGTATVTVTGKGNYTGSKSINFTINYKNYTITLDNQSATSAGTTTLYGRYVDGIYLDSSYSKKMTTSANNITKPTKNGYTFGGYYTAVNGGGTQLINASGYITSAFTNALYNSNVTLYAKWSANSYTVTFNSGNLITGLDDVSTTSADNMKYGVSNKVVTVSANSDDGYGFINARVYLDANTTYVFSCNTDGIWGSGGDTVEAFLMLNGEYNTYYHMDSNNNFEFTPTVGGLYWLRLDVNASGKTYTFSNITISKNITTKIVTYGETYGDLSTIDRMGYTFLGWYDSDKSGSKIVSSSKVAINSNHTLYAHWKANEYTINYNFNDTSNMSYWNYLYQDRFIINSYDESSKLTDMSVYGEGGWEIVYVPFTTIAGKKYTMSFDYQVPSPYSASGYSGVGYQILNKVPDNNDNSSNSIFTGNLPTSAVTTTKTITLSFTATGATTYLAFNFGMSADNATTRVKLGNIKLSTNVTYSEDSTVTFPTLSFNGYSFSGWSTNSKTKSVINDSNEYSGSTPSGASYFSDFKEYRLDAPFYSGDVYRLEVDAKGSGTLYNYFYGDSGYLQVARVVNSDGYDNSNTDGSNTINLTSGYKHYTVTFTLGSSGNGNVAKRILFRTMAGSSASVKNVKFYKLSSNESIYLSSANLNNLIVNNITNFYGMGHINSYTLTVNPNGGTYSSSTSNRSITQNSGTLYGLSTPSKSGSTFSGWSVSGSGSLIRGNASGEGSANEVTKSVKTDTDGSQYTNYTINYTNSGSGYSYPNIGFGNYSYTSGHTYRLSVMVRVRSLSGFGYFMLRHGAFNNDWGSNFMKAEYFSSDLISNDWVEYTIDNTFTGTTATMNGNSYTINPAIEIWSAIAGGSTGVLDMDIKNLRIYDITADTYVTDNSYGGYIYKFGNGNGSVTANYGANTYYVYYDANGGSGAPGTQSFIYNSGAKISTTTPTKTGYTFVNWKYGDTTFNPGDSIPTGLGSFTLTAQWSVNNYYLDLNGYLDGSSSGNISGYGTADVYVNGSLVCDDCTDYWAQQPYGSTYEIKDIKATIGHSYNGVYSGSASGTITGTTSVSLKFTTNTYYVYFDANGGSGAPGTQSYTYSPSGSITLSGTTPSRSGYNFLGWSTSFNGSPVYSAGSSFSTSITSNTTLYAIWGLPTGINDYRNVLNTSSGTNDIYYITSCDSTNSGVCYYNGKNLENVSGSVTRSTLGAYLDYESTIAYPIGSNQCSSSSCNVYIFTKPGLNSSSASQNTIIGVLALHRSSTTYPIYKTSTVQNSSRKVYFKYNTGANIITNFTLSYYAYGAGTIQKLYFKTGDTIYFGWVTNSLVK